jgi:hypothetical protein
MKVRKAVKRIVALGITSAMLGATLLAAGAADLKDFPRPLFVDNNGVFSGKFVVGRDAGMDNIGATMIMAAVQAAAYKETTVSGTGGSVVTVEGDAYQVKQGSNILELTEALSSVKQLVDKNGLTALKSGKFTTGRGTYDYDQYISLPTASVVYEKNSGGLPVDDTDKPAWFLKMANGAQAYEYQLKFVNQAESDESTSSTNHLKDFENKKITMLGKEMSLTSAINNSKDLSLTFMGGAVQDTLTEGQTKTYTIDGKDYEVTLVTVDSSSPAKALFKINGETTDSVNEGDTFRLSDGTELGIKTVLVQNFAEGKRMVEFYLGAEKVVLHDGDVTDGQYGIAGSADEVEYNSVSAYDTAVRIDATRGNPYKLSAIYVKWNPRDNYYLGKDVKLSSVTEKAGQVFLDGFDYVFKGVNLGNTETVTLSPSGDRQYYLNFVNYVGNNIRMPYVWTTGTAAAFGYSSGDALIFQQAKHVAKNSYFLVSKETNSNADSRSGYTYLVRYRGCSVSSLTCSFRNEATGDTIEVPVTSTTSNTTLYNLNIGGNTWAFRMNGTKVAGGKNDQDLYIDLVNGGSYTAETTATLIAHSTEVAPIYTKYGAKIDMLPGIITAGNGITITGFNVTTESVQTGSVVDKVEFHITQDTGNQRLSSDVVSTLVTGAWASSTSGLFTIAGGDDSEGYTKYGMLIHKRTDSNNPNTITLTYPENQAEALVYVSSGATTSTVSDGNGGTTTKTPVPIPASAVVFDNEISNAKTQSLIAIGGPCVNSVAATLLGVTDKTKCADGFTNGKATIKLFDSADGMATGKVAMLVAGYSGDDTRRAATVLNMYKDYASKLVGKEVTVTGTSLTDITVSAPSTN